ncbi:MAG: ADP-ribosylglycohydrolase family protein [Thiogranum sp.]
MQKLSTQDRFRGVLIGTAVGDALGLPAEGVSRRRVSRLFPGPWRHRLIAGRGMLSDDTEHTLFISQALLAQPTSVEAFARRFAWSLRWWFVSLPAGIGLGTLRSIVRLWLGFSPSNSGVRSAGNGPAMRAAPIGAMFANDAERRQAYVEASTRVTHADPRALVGAQVVANLCAWSVCTGAAERPQAIQFLELLRTSGEHEPQWSAIVEDMARAVTGGWSVQAYADSLGLRNGISGFIYHTVPVVSYAWYRHFGDFQATLTAVLDCGGDTDTTGAIAGALTGAVVSEQGIPRLWIQGIADWPRGVSLCYRVADQLYEASRRQQAMPVIRYLWPALLPRNFLFLLIVLAHGFRRLVPPY